MFCPEAEKTAKRLSLDVVVNLNGEKLREKKNHQTENENREFNL